MYVYMIGAFAPKRLVSVKVGVTSCLERRMSELQTAQALEIRIIAAWRARGRMHAFDVESQVHRTFGKFRVRGEWYRNHMIRKLRAYLEGKLGDPQVIGHNSKGARRRQVAMPERAMHDIRMIAWARQNGFTVESAFTVTGKQ